MKKSIKIRLSDNWKIQTSKLIRERGAIISTLHHEKITWIPANVPETVLGALVANKIYENPYFGDNLKAIPTEYFTVPWWYATHFTLDDLQSQKSAALYFDGINYKANVWLNGRQITDIKKINGAYRRTSFDVSEHVVAGENMLAVEIVPPKPGDFSTGFVDWNPAPPDGNMGIFRPVTLELHKGVRIENPFIQTKVDLKTLKRAELTVSAELKNDTREPISGILKGTIESTVFEHKITVPANKKIPVEFTAAEFPQLAIENPRLWWPIHFGSPELYELELEFTVDGQISSVEYTKFGIREVEEYWLNNIHRGFKINGQKVLIKGAGWTDDLFLRNSDKNLEAQVRYVKQMNLNCIRLEGIWGKDHRLYDLCDEHGILLMVGWSCHWEHEIHMGVPVDERFGGVYKSEDIEHVAQAWEDQVIWLRNHPSIFVWTVASDKVPIGSLEQKYIETFAKYDPTRPYLNSTGGVGSDRHVIGSEAVVSEISGSSGVKMLGPYAYTAPVYWFTDTNFGGAYGFNTETGPGAQIPQLDSLKKFIPENKLWPINDIWEYHCGRYEFSDLNRFIEAMDARYGRPHSIEEFDKKAQAMNYELMRPMFEAFQVNKSKCTGIIQWMLNAAWPKMYWQLYDYYLMPTGAFYATQKACSPLHLVYNYGDHQVYAINDNFHKVNDLKAHIRIYDIDSKLVLEENLSFDALADSSIPLFKINTLKTLSTTYFLDLRLSDGHNREISSNFYWLSTQEETLDYAADLGEFAYHTPSKHYADLNLLNTLPKVDLEVSYNVEKDVEEQTMTAIVKNTGEAIAFLINLKVIEKDTGEIILPIFWEDNFISLLPGERRTLRTTFAGSAAAELKVEGWNLNTINYAKISDSRRKALL
ncbi:exo-1,4-beta-D-glucosaminidase [Pricia antarctica]|uniref:Exo-1,4-beta-D-glucosaminidase n=1 Tax=Pricia antarctica TaxID=641691 RepID=A0A1G7HG63_9FLAO|nr:sugar-binding domain-containing protein [Pricia antarctica]SDE99294.1 exo-1,4-beta-D-glucosaminidase [Pricia antarctica]